MCSEESPCRPAAPVRPGQIGLLGASGELEDASAWIRFREKQGLMLFRPARVCRSGEVTYCLMFRRFRSSAEPQEQKPAAGEETTVQVQSEGSFKRPGGAREGPQLQSEEPEEPRALLPLDRTSEDLDPFSFCGLFKPTGEDLLTVPFSEGQQRHLRHGQSRTGPDQTCRRSGSWRSSLFPALWFCLWCPPAISVQNWSCREVLALRSPEVSWGPSEVTRGLLEVT